MKITSFNPLVVSSDAASTIKIFEDLGFEKTHSKDSVNNDLNYTAVRMKDANGFHVDVANVPTVPQDMTLIRMNVDNFEEAYEFLTARGFTNPRGGQTVDTKSNKSCMMKSPSGFAFDLCQHIKDHD